MTEYAKGIDKSYPAKNQDINLPDFDCNSNDIRVNFAVVSKVYLQDIPKILSYISSRPDSKVLYIARDVGRLTIVRERRKASEELKE